VSKNAEAPKDKDSKANKRCGFGGFGYGQGLGYGPGFGFGGYGPGVGFGGYGPGLGFGGYGPGFGWGGHGYGGYPGFLGGGCGGFYKSKIPKQKSKDVKANTREEIPELNGNGEKKQTIHLGYGYASGDNYRLGYGMGGMGGLGGYHGPSKSDFVNQLIS
jgi:hypothetical protein